MRKIRLLLLSSLILLACVPTPQNEIVVNKGDQTSMINMARVEVSLDAPIAQGEAPKMDYRGAFGVPERLTLDTDEAEGKVRLVIDADISD